VSDELGFMVLAFTSLLAIVNPLGAVPIYVAMTISYEKRQRSATLRRAIVTGFIVLVAFAVLGPFILRFFGITTQAFQVAGGIIFFGVGWDMLNARRTRSKTTEEEQTESAAKQDVGIIPLGLPTLVGPGAITTVIALNGQAVNAYQVGGIYISIVGVLLISWALLAAAPAVTRRIGQTGMNVMTRLMGLLVMVVGAQFVINGVSVVALDILSRSGGAS
jgi:multiple antibiotic resistance protein